MADEVAAMTATLLAQPGSTDKNTSFQERSRLGFNWSNGILKKTSSYLALDLSECTSTLNKRLLKDIRKHLQTSIKVANQIKEVNIEAMSKDNCKDHYYFMFVASQIEKDAFYIYKNK